MGIVNHLSIVCDLCKCSSATFKTGEVKIKNSWTVIRVPCYHEEELVECEKWICPACLKKIAFKGSN